MLSFKKKVLDFFNNDLLDLSMTDNLIILFVIIFTFITLFFIKKILSRLFYKSYRAELLINNLVNPSKLLLLILGLTFAAELAYNGRPEDFISNSIDNLRIFGVVFSISWFCLNLIKQIEHTKLRALTEAKRYRERTTVKAVTRLIKIALSVTVILIFFKSAGIDITGLVTIAGIGTAAIGLAAKDLFSNFFATFTIYIDKPFIEGDSISSPDRNIEGTVDEIGWRMTKITSYEKGTIFVPNSVFATISIVNSSKTRHRRIKKIFFIDYKNIDSVQRITDKVQQFLECNDDIEHGKDKYIKLINFSNHAIEIELSLYTRTCNQLEFQNIQQDILLKISDIVKDEKGKFAVQQ